MPTLVLDAPAIDVALTDPPPVEAPRVSRTLTTGVITCASPSFRRPTPHRVEVSGFRWAVVGRTVARVSIGRLSWPAACSAPCAPMARKDGQHQGGA